MKIDEVKVGDHLWDVRRDIRFVVTALRPFSNHQNGEIDFTASGRKRCMTWRQFERLSFVRKEG